MLQFVWYSFHQKPWQNCSDKADSFSPLEQWKLLFSALSWERNSPSFLLSLQVLRLIRASFIHVHLVSLYSQQNSQFAENCGPQRVVSRLAAASPGNLLEMQISGPQTRPTESETLGVRPSSLVLTSHGDFHACSSLRRKKPHSEFQV